MLHHNLLLIISLLFATSMLVMLGQKLRISYPIFLVLGGLIISLLPGIPRFSIDPQLVFIIFLPPLLYEAAWYTSWREFWKWKRPISLLAFGLVIFTSTAVALFSKAVIPGFTMALGFLLGGIISPPDAVAATSVLKGMNIPKRVLTILEGESLVNDASSLIVFRFALAAVVSGQFVLHVALVNFFVVALMGIGIGLAIGYLAYLVHKYFPTTPSIDTAITFMCPYLMYVVAEEFHFSGVMAVVSGGLFLSYKSHEVFSNTTRLQAASVWATVVFLMNGLVFILIGLQLPIVLEGLGAYSIREAIGYGIAISLLTIILRIVWVYPGTYLPRILFKKIRTTERRPDWRAVFVLSWAGMRGVVSLASALSIPLLLTNGDAFPQRNLIFFITFVVILFTLVLQGLSLPWVIRKLKVAEIDDVVPEEEQAMELRLRLKKASLAYLKTHNLSTHPNRDRIESLISQYENDVYLISQRLEQEVCTEDDRQLVKKYKGVLKGVVDAQRKELLLVRKEQLYDEEVLRKQEAQLDLEETGIYLR